jgi:hypothetical protein
MTDTKVADRASIVKSVRDRIEAVVTPEQRRAILIALGCFEPPDQDTVPRLRRAKVPTTSGGAELLSAIDALDRACLRDSVDEIEEAGERLTDLWTMFR